MRGLDRAARDERVVALIARFSGNRLKIGTAQEIRAAVARLRAAGKHTVAWAESFGEFRPGLVPYYLATAFEQICLQPSGDLGITGVSVESWFLHDALRKAGVRPQVDQRHEYKTAGNMLTEPGFTEAHREADERLVASLSEQIIEGIAAGRGLGVDEVRSLADRAPLSAQEALEARLIDDIRYRDEVYARTRERHGREARLLYVTRYAKTPSLRPRIPGRGEDAVALVPVHGTIRLGRGGVGPVVGSDAVTGALRAAIDDDKVRAIVLDVESPGGSYAASDAIWRETERAKDRGKTVVGHSADVAASGGYYVLMGADAIVTQPCCLTGSIGVFGGKPVLTDMLARLGIGRDGVGAGRRARMFSKAAPFTEDEWDLLSAWLDRVYAAFVAKAAEGRDMPPDRMHGLAKGRVWTGADARDNGLVDELGDLEAAVALARRKAGLGGKAPVRLYPRTGALRRLRPARSSDDAGAAMSLGWESWGALAGLAGRLGLPVDGPLLLPCRYEIG
ncbi:S49 family peptidase [Actinomadura rubrisoli]|uniref:S49 family peptidase n=1 Tax=Actinomadura rubrisoli TaxID=2530368 RepID=UPI001FB704FA|nr:S49 family peptidase [Actinomadura rubrisoli]